MKTVTTILSALVWLTLAAQAAAKDAESPLQLIKTYTNADLIADAKRDGQSIVIAELTLPKGFTDPAKLTKPQRAAQRERIAAAQQAFAKSLAPELAVHYASKLFPLVVVEADVSSILDWVKNPNVKRLFPNRVMQPLLAQSTLAIGSMQTNRVGYRGAGQAIAIIDTGIDTSHPAFGPIDGRSRFVSEACFSMANSGPRMNICGSQPQVIGLNSALACAQGMNAQCGHGTQVAGVALGRSSYLFQQDGVAPEADIVAIRAGFWAPCSATSANVCHYFDDGALLASLEHALQLQLNNVVELASVNLSLGAGRSIDPVCRGSALEPVLGSLRNQGVAVVAGSGNSAIDSSEEDDDDAEIVTLDGLAYPACLADILSVGAVSDSEVAPNVAQFSQPGSALDFVAPGAGITTTQDTVGFTSASTTKSGTSFAAPHAAGAFALLREAVPASALQTLVTTLQTDGLQLSDTRIKPWRTVTRIEVNSAIEALQSRVFPVTIQRVVPINSEFLEVQWEPNRHRRVLGSSRYTAIATHTGQLSFAIPEDEGQSRSAPKARVRVTTGTPYSIVVTNCANNICGTSEALSAVLPLPTPTNFHPTQVGGGAISVAWDASPYAAGESEFQIRDVSSSRGSTQPNTDTDWQLTNQNPGYTAHFWLKECRRVPLMNDAHCSAPANLSVSLATPPAPPAPYDMHLCGRPGEFCLLGGGLNFTWFNRPSHLTTHLLFEWMIVGSGQWSRVQLHPKAGVRKVFAPSGTLVNARVRACNTTSCSNPSNTATVTTP